VRAKWNSSPKIEDDKIEGWLAAQSEADDGVSIEMTAT
jgi:hypothetical protein